MNLEQEKKAIFLLSLVDVFVISTLIIAAVIMQFYLQEIPCPLCLLQRFGIMAVSIGFLMNLRFGIRASHYALSMLAAVYTGFVALRQMSLHIIPGDKGYGDALFGLHLYTWVFISAVAMILFITLLMLVDEQFKQVKKFRPPKSFNKIVSFAFGLVLLVMVVNLVVTFMECGLQQCPDNPVTYKYLADPTA